ncbi:MAG: tol-pal system protein YbgF [Gammaproteobacteria bacterium]|nr:tol-pal system protein YbgF [Gammaproteobacteria bacterium]MCP5425067.1 tol-pal system protein YbgF [Gammaproteobacteria bacterium]
MQHWLRLLSWGLIAVGLVGALPVGAQANRDQLVFELLNRVEQLEQEVRQLRGDLEVYRYRQEDLERRLQVEGSANAPDYSSRGSTPGTAPEVVDRYAPAQTTLPTVTAPPANPPPAWSQPPASDPQATYQPRVEQPPASVPTPATGDEREVYTTAFSGLREGHYDQAIADFNSFLQSYPQSELAGNAQYWLGEAYYVKRDFDPAKEAFINLGIRYPNSERVPDALLKLGYIYDEQGDRAKAKDVLQKLVDTYPGTQAARLGASRLSSMQ